MTDRKALAWIGVFDGEPDPEFIWHDEAKARRWINTRPGVELAPLAIAPTLTDAEREAVEWAILTLANSSSERVGVAMDNVIAAQQLRKLLKRLD